MYTNWHKKLGTQPYPNFNKLHIWKIMGNHKNSFKLNTYPLEVSYMLGWQAWPSLQAPSHALKKDRQPAERGRQSLTPAAPAKHNPVLLEKRFSTTYSKNIIWKELTLSPPIYYVSFQWLSQTRCSHYGFRFSHINCLGCYITFFWITLYSPKERSQ